MASKTLKATNGRSNSSAKKSEVPAPDSALAFSQSQLQSLIALADVMFKGAEEMRRCQMQAAHNAREHHEAKQAEVAGAHSPAELFNLQSDLLRFDFDSAGKYWQQLAAIVAATQAEAMNLVTRSAATVGGDVAKMVAQPLAMPGMASTSARSADVQEATSLDPNQAWNQWVGLGKQWTDMLYRTEAALH